MGAVPIVGSDKDVSQLLAPWTEPVVA